MARIYIGTSGWQYSHWKGNFYPQDLPIKDWLRFYSRYFQTVEINSTFYRQTKASTFQKWQEEVNRSCLPAGKFVFAVKGNRFITHIKRLKDCQELLERFFEAASFLRGKHVILWQLPPKFPANPERLASFLKLLPKTWRHAFEFRSSTWLTVKIYELLRQSGAAVVFQDYPDWPMTKEVTADFVYLRFHGTKELYSSPYIEAELKAWASEIKTWLRRGKDVYAYFNNDALGYAVPNARCLQELIGK